MSHAAILVALDESPAAKKKVEKLVEWQMAPFDENGHWFKNGSRWDWWQIGGRYTGSLGDNKDVILKGDLKPEALLAEYESDARKAWIKAHEEPDRNLAGLVYGVRPGETEEQYIQRNTCLCFYAFLRNRQWHENERLGFFGGTARTECEVATGDEPKGKCLHRDKKTGAKIVVWNDANWNQKFWRRFVEPLHDSTLLVVVDYHV